MIIVECFKDQALVYRMGFTPDQVGHERGRSRVLAKVEQEQKAIAIIDEDPNAPQPEYLKQYDERDAEGEIRLLISKDDDGQRMIHRVIQISPRLEDWLYNAAKRSRISPENFGLPDNPEELHAKSLKRDRDFRRFLIALIRAGDDEVSKLREWIMEAMTE